MDAMSERIYKIYNWGSTYNIPKNVQIYVQIYESLLNLFLF